MSKVASEADFLQCDITYDDCKEHPFLFNAVAFDHTAMEWVVVGRVRLGSQSSASYALCYKKNCLKSVGVQTRTLSLD